MSENRPIGSPACHDIGDDLIELYALNRIDAPDPDVIAHILSCEKCLERMAEANIRAAVIRQVLSEQLI